MVACNNSSTSHEVVFVVDGGTAIETVVTDVIEKAPETEKNGFLLAGWYLDSEFTYKASFPHTVLGVTNLYAKWEPAYMLTYRLNGEIIRSESHIAGDILTTFTPTAADIIGREFNGWLSSIPSIMPAQNLVIDGATTSKSYKICFETASDVSYTGYEGLYTTTDNMVTVNYPYIAVRFGYSFRTQLNAVRATRDRYDFDGWTYYDSEKSERLDYLPTDTWDNDKNILLRPKWVQFGTQGLVFSKIPHNDGPYVMVSDYTGIYETVIIPPTYEGKTVLQIGASAFSGATNITSMTIPSTVTIIGENAFYGCTNIVSVSLTNSIETIGKGAFAGCSSLLEFKIPEKVVAVQALTFADCTALTKIEFPTSGNFLRIDDQAFQNNVSLFNVVLPISLKVIGKYAFENCRTLTFFDKITQSNLQSIGDGAFRGCSNLERITFPSTVTMIGEEAFKDCEKLLQLSVQENIISIGAKAFMNCTLLQRFSVPRSVSTIGAHAFLNTKTLIYVATVDEDEWPPNWALEWNLKDAESNTYHTLHELIN